EGGKAVVFPCIEIADPDSWEACDRALSRLAEFDGFVFTSGNAVEYFFRRSATDKALGNGFKSKLFLAVGEKTEALLEKNGVHAVTVPEEFSGTALAASLTSEQTSGKKFLFPCGDLARHSVIDGIEKMGGSVEPVIVYRTKKPGSIDPRTIEYMLSRHEIDIITFTSPSAVDNFFGAVPVALIEAEHKVRYASIGGTTAEAITKKTAAMPIVAPTSTIQGLTDRIIEYYQANA
ncbi:MAG TPA: uroporphyrinogen-III synthase, partial [Bacteroidota bacterium]|nr:uroporphyrinogen-III synthase [Bacteroidota bacterium]